MAKWLLIPLMAVTLAGCVAERSPLPLALAPSDTAQASCLGIGSAPAYDCEATGAPASK
jgi:hypothetical protein